MPSKRERIPEIRIENYYKAYRKNYPNKGIVRAKQVALNWAIGIHNFVHGDKGLEEAIKEYKKFINSLE